MFEKNGVAILTPEEYRRLKSFVKPKFQRWLDLLLFTGMRYAEALKFMHRKELYKPERRCIFLPHEIDKKAQRAAKERYVYLSYQGMLAVERFFSFLEKYNQDHQKPLKYPSYIGMDYNLRQWSKKLGFEYNVTVKSFRKTWESYLTVSFQDRVALIALSQGHTDLTSLNHYIQIPFTDDEKRQIQEFVVGWLQ